MIAFYCKSFKGHNPVGAAAIVVDKDQASAARALERELAAVGLAQTIDPKTMIRIVIWKPSVKIILDGEY